jgi:hypothetical protein
MMGAAACSDYYRLSVLAVCGPLPGAFRIRKRPPPRCLSIGFEEVEQRRSPQETLLGRLPVLGCAQGEAPRVIVGIPPR